MTNKPPIRPDSPAGRKLIVNTAHSIDKLLKQLRGNSPPGSYDEVTADWSPAEHKLYEAARNFLLAAALIDDQT